PPAEPASLIGAAEGRRRRAAGAGRIHRRAAGAGRSHRLVVAGADRALTKAEEVAAGPSLRPTEVAAAAGVGCPRPEVAAGSQTPSISSSTNSSSTYRSAGGAAPSSKLRTIQACMARA